MNALAPYKTLLVKQNKKGCLQTLLCGTGKNEFGVATLENPIQDVFYVKEESDCCARYCCPQIHPFSMVMSIGNQAGGMPVANFERPWKCSAAPCKCCCFQSITIKDDKNAPIGEVVESCYFCIPSYKVLDHESRPQYKIEPPSCCCGMCVNFCAEGCCNCRVPLYVFLPDDAGKDGNEKGKMVKVWNGLGNELLNLDKYELVFPIDANVETKARLVGALFLMNEIFFASEREQEGSAGDLGAL